MSRSSDRSAPWQGGGSGPRRRKAGKAGKAGKAPAGLFSHPLMNTHPIHLPPGGKQRRTVGPSESLRGDGDAPAWPANRALTLPAPNVSPCSSARAGGQSGNNPRGSDGSEWGRRAAPCTLHAGVRQALPRPLATSQHCDLPAAG